VVRPDIAEGARERPVGEPEEPTLQARRRLRLGPERVRIGERRGAPLELVADEPEAPAELEVVARRGLAIAGGGPGEVVALDVADRRPRRPQRADGIESERNGDEANRAGRGASSHRSESTASRARDGEDASGSGLPCATPALDDRLPAELLGDSGDSADHPVSLEADKNPLVGRPPLDKEPAAVGRRRDLVEHARAGEHGATRFELRDGALASSAESRDENLVGPGPERGIDDPSVLPVAPGEERSIACEDEHDPVVDDEQAPAVCGPLELRVEPRTERRPC